MPKKKKKKKKISERKGLHYLPMSLMRMQMRRQKQLCLEESLLFLLFFHQRWCVPFPKARGSSPLESTLTHDDKSSE